MINMGSGSNNRYQVMAALAMIQNGSDAKDLSDYISERDKVQFLSLIDAYAKDRDGKTRAEKLLRQHAASERFSSLAEIHPAWILDKLKNESPRIIGIILRSLSSKHVRYILKNLSPMIRAQLPSLIESFSVSQPVMELIRQNFEKHFLPMRISHDRTQICFDKLYFLKSDDLRELVKDIGMTELAIALCGLSGKSTHAVLNRLDFKDAKRIQKRMKELSTISPWLFRQSRFTVLEVEASHIGPDKMFLRLGLAVLAEAIDEESVSLLPLIQQRLEPVDAYLFKRFYDECRARVTSDISGERQALIMNLVFSLAKDGKIDPLWAAADLPPPPQSYEDETATVQLLA